MKLGLLLVLLAAAQTPSKTITIGLYAPAAPFEGMPERLELMGQIASELERATAGFKVQSRVYMRAKDFSAAVRAKEIAYAVIDAPYDAALGMIYPPIAAAVRGEQTSSEWAVVSSAEVSSLADLRGKRLVVPEIGAEEDRFVTDVLFEGEVKRAFFGAITHVVDPQSAMIAVQVGRADAALVPGHLPLPEGLHRALTLRSIPGQLFVALPSAPPSLAPALAEALGALRSKPPIEGFSKTSVEDAGRLAQAFLRTPHRGPLPSVSRIDLGELLQNRRYAIPRTDLSSLAEMPHP